MSRRHAATVLVAMLLLAACVGTRLPPLVAPAPAAAALDGSYDWHVLVTAPFGTLLKDLPFTVHEVLLFQDATQKPPQSEDAECYATDQEAPRFLDRLPDPYLLCFKHDRLARIVAAVRLPQPDAAKIFADACGVWMKPAAAPDAPICTATAGPISFSARLESGSKQQQADDALLSVTLIAESQ